MSSPSQLTVEVWPVSRLRLDPGNPRLHPPSQIRQIAASIQEFGFTNPVLVDSSGTIIAGEARLAAAQHLRHTTLPVIVLGHLSATQRKAYRVADNRLPEGASWDERMLAEVLAELQTADFDLLTTGFSDDELSALFAGLSPPDPPAEEDNDHVPPLPATPCTRLGDVWIMGPHRLICGDSTKSATLARLMDSGADVVFTDPPYGMAYDGGRSRRKAALIFTDPPYGMSFGKGKDAGSSAPGATVKAHGMIMGDDAQGDDLVDLVGEALKRGAEFAKPGAAAYVCFTWRTYGEFARAVLAAGLSITGCIVWDKGSIGLGFQHYRPRHEFIFYCRGARWYGGRTEADVWSFSRGATADYVHPTQKPVELVCRALANSSLPGDVVLDLFGGSGSTLIACEKLGRSARLVELDPKYCDVIVRRWQAFSTRTAALASTGDTFDHLRATRSR
jgi:DNA modification methylase